MSIRNAAKAVLIHNGEILVNRCCSFTNELYYTLPGGKQNQYETLEETVVRECAEETGYVVVTDRFLALYEEIVTGQQREMAHPDYSHKLFFLFLCHITGGERSLAYETDADQKGSLWVRLDAVKSLNFYPTIIKDTLLNLLQNDYPAYLGSEKTDSSLAWIPRDTLNKDVSKINLGT